MQSHLRACWRMMAFGLSTGAAYAISVLGSGLLARWPAAARRWRLRVLRRWASALIRLLGIRLTVSGTPPVAPFLLVANHLSYVDVLVLASQLEGVFIAKHEVAAWPVLGWLCRHFDTIFVKREQRAEVWQINQQIAQRLAAQTGVVFFPEGTSSPGERVLPFKPALLAAAVQGGQPVSYAALHYQTSAPHPPAREAVCWWGEMTLLPHLYRLFQLPSFEARLVFGSQTWQARDRKVLALQLWQAVSQAFTLLAQLAQAPSEEPCNSIPKPRPAIPPNPRPTTPVSRRPLAH